MYMPYTKNPQMPELRMKAVRLVQEGWSVREVARHLNYAHNTILNWLKRKPEYGTYGRLVIPTRSSKPSHHPNTLKPEIVKEILRLRNERQQCAEILHYRLGEEGVVISLSSVQRVLRRFEMRRFSRYKKWHTYPPRPIPEKPGILVQIDTVWDGLGSERLYIYTLLDVCSRWAYAEPMLEANTFRSIEFLERAKIKAPFQFQTIQSDHGSEFARRFSIRTQKQGMAHRHSRIRTPNDNAHLERFNRTIQDECINQISRNLKSWKKEIPDYLRYYNTERPHMGLRFKTPLEVVRSY